MPRLALTAFLACLLPAAGWAQTWPNETGYGGDTLRQTIATMDRLLGAPATPGRSSGLPGAEARAPVPILDWSPPPATPPAPARRAAPARRVVRQAAAPAAPAADVQWLERRLAEREQRLAEMQRQIETDRRTLESQRTLAATPGARPPAGSPAPGSQPPGS